MTRFFGLLLLVGCLTCVFLFEGESSADPSFRFLHWPAMVLTGIGPMALIMICFDRKLIGKAMWILAKKSPDSLMKSTQAEGVFLQNLSKNYYEQGAMAFAKANSTPFTQCVQDMISRLAVRMPTADILEILHRDRDRWRIQCYQVINVVSIGVRLAPSLGMLGTILGMVRLLSTLTDPSHIGSTMSLALLTTFYGLFFSIVLWTPLQQKLERLLFIGLDNFDQAIRWLDLLERRKPTQYFVDSIEERAHGNGAKAA